MDAESNRVSDAAPLLFRHATPRTASSTGDLPGHYDTAAQLWVIETPAGLVPVIQADPSTQLETSTSTRVRQEGDDEDMSKMVGLAATIGLSTTTAVKMEADDPDRTPGLGAIDVLLDTSTLTKVRQEGDDEDMSNMASLIATTTVKEVDDTVSLPAMRALDMLLETNTLTEVRQEADDTDISSDATLMTPRRLGTFADLVTKTDVQQESDDKMRGGARLELETRSLNNQEGVDHGFENMLLDLQTKTYTDMESDDESSVIH